MTAANNLLIALISVIGIILIGFKYRQWLNKRRFEDG